MAPFSINGGHLGSCALIVPDRDFTEEFGVVVGHALVDASTPSANVLIINPNAEEVVLPVGHVLGSWSPCQLCLWPGRNYVCQQTRQ